MKYDLIYCDPPWEYGNKISNGAACNHYSTMSMEELKRLPIWSLAAENAVLAMWYTGTHNREAVELAESWGFRVRTMKGFTWVKLNQNAADRFNKALSTGALVDFNDLLEMLDRETRMNGKPYAQQYRRRIDCNPRRRINPRQRIGKTGCSYLPWRT